MFAGLPGIGVGTLFYVLMAWWMPIHECGRRLVRGGPRRRWRFVLREAYFGLAIVASITAADRLLMYVLGVRSPTSLHPARLLHEGLAAQFDSLVAAPLFASLLVLLAVLAVVEIACLVWARPARAARLAPTRLSDRPANT